MNNIRKQLLIAMLGLMISTAIPQLAAQSTVFNLNHIDPEITKIEFKIDKDPWADVDLNLASIDLAYPTTGEERLYIRQYKGKNQVGGDYIYRYDDRQGTWIYIAPSTSVPGYPPSSAEKVDVIMSPYATMLVTDRNIRYMYTLPFGIGLDVALSFPFHRNLLFKSDVEVSLAFVNNNNIWADSFLIFGADVGLGYRFPIAKHVMLTPSVLYGLFFQYNIDGSLEKSLSYSHHIELDIEVGYQINDKMHAFGSPHAQMMIDSSGYGFLYGLRAGVGFVL